MQTKRYLKSNYDRSCPTAATIGDDAAEFESGEQGEEDYCGEEALHSYDGWEEWSPPEDVQHLKVSENTVAKNTMFSRHCHVPLIFV